MHSAAQQQYEFRGFRLDRRKRSLVDPAGAPVPLNAKAFDTLLYLLEHPGEVVERATILEAVWPDTTVEENNLSQAVAALRRALGDGFIVTVTGRGYQFVAEVRTGADVAPERSRRPWIYASLVAVLITGAAFTLSRLAPGFTDAGDRTTPRDRRSIAVLPFANDSAAEENAEFFANGIHDELLTRLVRIRDLKVISRTSVEAYRDSSKSLQEIGRELGVATLLEGRVQRAADRVRINVQLIDAESDEHLWAETYDRELSAENVFAIQSDMAISIARALEAELSPQELSLLEDVPTSSTRAYDFFLTAMDYFRRRTDPQNFIPLALQAVERAVEEDPEFASGWAALSMMHSEMYWFHFDRSAERLEKAERAARQALALSPELPEAHLALALYHYRSARDYEAALEELAIAERSCPECVEVLSIRGSILRRRGRFDESGRVFERILERDPRNVFQLSAHQLVNDQYLRDYRHAAETLERILELVPDDPTALHEKGLLPMLRDGDPTLLLEYLENPPTPGYLAEPGVRVDLWRAALYERAFDRAVEAVTGAGTSSLFGPPELYTGLAHLCAGRDELAASELAEAREKLEGRLSEVVDDPASEARLLVLQAYALAGLGERQAAVDAVRRARTVLPKTTDALVGARIQYHSLLALALAGAEDEALDELDDYLSGDAPWSIEGLLPDPRLDGIRRHPGLAELVARHQR